MQSFDADDWRFAFWSALSLELLGRAALGKISPVLLADAREDWNNVYLALGHAPTSAKFVPKSILTTEVFNRVQATNAAFLPEMRAFCSLHTGHRNAELHSAEMPFDCLDPAVWLPNYYVAAEVLASMAGTDMEGLFGIEAASAAKQLVSAAADKAAESVKADINAHRKVWQNKSPADQKKLATQGEIWAVSHEGHVADCPSCGSKGLLTGEPMAAAKKTISHDTITERQEHLPEHLPKVFECIACGLKVNGLSRLRASGLGAPFTNTIEYDAAEYYAPEPDYEYADYNNE